MTYGPHIVIGVGDGSVLEKIPDGRRAEIVVLPGETEPALERPDWTYHFPETLGDAQYILRNVFRDHEVIATLAGAEYWDQHPLSAAATTIRSDWSPHILARLARYIESPGNDQNDSWLGASHALAHGLTLATAPTSDDLFNFYEGRPAISIAAGPSAEAHLDRIAAVQSAYVIFVVDVMLRACLERGIVPDFVCSIERIDDTYERIFKDQTIPTAVTLLSPVVIDPRVVKAAGNRVLWYWRPDGLEKWINPKVIGRNIGNSCGTLSVAAPLVAGCNPVYLVGHDLAAPTEGATHATSAHESAHELVDLIKKKSDYYDREDIGGGLYTTRLWRMFHADIEHMIRLAPGRSVISVDPGLRLDGAGETNEIPNAYAPFEREKPTRWRKGPDPRRLIPTILKDCDRIMRRCTEKVLTAEKLALSTMVSRRTFGLWRDLTVPLYIGGLTRLHLRDDPTTPARVLYHTARTLWAFARRVKKELTDAASDAPACRAGA